ncbi:MAG: hypothetical protein AB1772_05905 [Candidatus Zixiibacteriota bacterium]
MKYSREDQMYPHVSGWLEAFLKDRHRHAEIRVIDASRKSLSRLITDYGFQDRVPAEWVSWDIQVDVVGFVLQKQQMLMAFVECKVGFLTLRDLSQLLGYSRVALPRYSFLVSPEGPSDFLTSLLRTYNRSDVLRYNFPIGQTPWSIAVGRWIGQAKNLDWSSVISDDVMFLGQL